MKEEALAYFKRDDSFLTIFVAFKKKYQSLGRVGGAVPVEALAPDALSATARFYGVSTAEIKERKTVTLKSFERQLHETKFFPLSLKTLLEAYFGETLRSNQEIKQQKQTHREAVFSDLAKRYPNLTFWFDAIDAYQTAQRLVYKMMNASLSTFTSYVHELSEAEKNLPNTYIHLPLFSQRISGDPHAFDVDTTRGKLFLHLVAIATNNIAWLTQLNNNDVINDLLFSVNILRDDITNFVTCYHLLAEVDGKLDPVFKAATDHDVVLNVPLKELVKCTRVYPSASEHCVFVVENSGVYSSLLASLRHVPLICTHGQLRRSALLLIDLLVKADVTIYYSGDLDPEGIRIADRLLKRHVGSVKLWKMDLLAYNASRAKGVKLNQKRLNQLDAVTDKQFAFVVSEMKKTANPGYQEALVDEMISELKRKS